MQCGRAINEFLTIIIFGIRQVKLIKRRPFAYSRLTEEIAWIVVAAGILNGMEYHLATTNQVQLFFHELCEADE